MKAGFKKKLMQMLKLQHTHLDPYTKQPSMKEALQCKECGEQVAKAHAMYQRYRKTNPEWFIYKEPEFKRSPELEKDFDMLAERKQKDPLYREHIRRLAHGTEQEKDEEVKKSNEGYYQTHYVDENGSVKEIIKNNDSRGTNT